MQNLDNNISADKTRSSHSSVVTGVAVGASSLVDLLFERINTDRLLPKPVKTALGRLRDLCKTIAVNEPDFIENIEHPLTQLLGLVADSGIHWVNNDGTEYYQVFTKIDALVSQLLTLSAADTEQMHVLNDEFTDYVESLSRRQDGFERRAYEKVLGEEKLLEAKLQVSNEVRMRTDQRDIPSVVLLLLLQPWSEYMSFVLLRYGTRSDSWAQALQTIDNVLWSFEPKITQSEMVKQREVQEELIISIERGLSTIGYDKTKIEKQLENLSALWRIASLSRLPENYSPVKREAKKIDKAGYPYGLLETLTDDEVVMLDKLLALEFGTWIELSDGKREKIVWLNKKTQRFLLVDQLGRRTQLVSGVQLARDILAGKTQLFLGSNKPFINSVLHGSQKK
jgi:Protein of unknown function (DUF1631)